MKKNSFVDQSSYVDCMSSVKLLENSQFLSSAFNIKPSLPY